MKYVTDYTSVTELSAALLTPQGVMVPAYGNVPEHRMNLDNVIANIPEHVFAYCAAMSLTAKLAAGITMDTYVRMAADIMAQELLSDWEVAA